MSRRCAFAIPLAVDRAIGFASGPVSRRQPGKASGGIRKKDLLTEESVAPPGASEPSPPPSPPRFVETVSLALVSARFANRSYRFGNAENAVSNFGRIRAGLSRLPRSRGQQRRDEHGRTVYQSLVIFDSPQADPASGPNSAVAVDHGKHSMGHRPILTGLTESPSLNVADHGNRGRSRYTELLFYLPPPPPKNILDLERNS